MDCQQILLISILTASVISSCAGWLAVMSMHNKFFTYPEIKEIIEKNNTGNLRLERIKELKRLLEEDDDDTGY